MLTCPASPESAAAAGAVTAVAISSAAAVSGARQAAVRARGPAVTGRPHEPGRPNEYVTWALPLAVARGSPLTGTLLQIVDPCIRIVTARELQLCNSCQGGVVARGPGEWP